MNFSEGDIVRLKGMGSALWRIETLGEETYYEISNDPLWEVESIVSLYLPDPKIPRSVYPGVTWSLREFMVPVPVMVVLAWESSRTQRSGAKELLLEQKYKRRLSKLRQLEDADPDRAKAYRSANPDLCLKQEHLKMEWSNGVRFDSGPRR